MDYETYDEVIAANPIAMRTVQSAGQELRDRGRSKLDIVNELTIAKAVVVALANNARRLLEELRELDSVCPRKMEVGGRTYVWHCPDELVPYRPLALSPHDLMMFQRAYREQQGKEKQHGGS